MNEWDDLVINVNVDSQYINDELNKFNIRNGANYKHGIGIDFNVVPKE